MTERVGLTVQRNVDLEEGYNTYQVTKAGLDIVIVFVLPQAMSRDEEELMQAVFTSNFRSAVFTQFAIDDMEKGFDPNAFQ